MTPPHNIQKLSTYTTMHKDLLNKCTIAKQISKNGWMFRPKTKGIPGMILTKI